VKQVVAYKCSSCAMTSMRKSSVARHEKNTCRKNPERKICLNCAHYYDDGEDDNGMEGENLQTFRDAGCLIDCIAIDSDTEHYNVRNVDFGCPEFKSKLEAEANE